jgi:hypothetical protein
VRDTTSKGLTISTAAAQEGLLLRFPLPPFSNPVAPINRAILRLRWTEACYRHTSTASPPPYTILPALKAISCVKSWTCEIQKVDRGWQKTLHSTIAGPKPDLRVTSNWLDEMSVLGVAPHHHPFSRLVDWSPSPESRLVQLVTSSIEDASPIFCGEGSFGNRLELRPGAGFWRGHRLAPATASRLFRPTHAPPARHPTA